MSVSPQFERTEMLLGTSAIEKLNKSRVAVFGIGGVGGAAAEALVRGGVGSLDFIDPDTVSVTNINRQLIATHDTIGELKTEAMRKRALSINPDVNIKTHNIFYLPENADSFDLSVYDYIVDAIDTVSAKIELIVRADKLGIPIISSMGTGNKLDPSRFVVTDLYKTTICPLARVLRRELKARGIKKLKVVYSDEEPLTPLVRLENNEQKTRRSIPGSVSFVPPVAGYLMAGEVLRYLSEK